MARKRYEKEIRLGQGSDNEEWDDSALIEAYDKAMNSIKEKLSLKKKNPSKPSHSSTKKGKKSGKAKWSVGDYCQAVYSKDKLPYEAEILEINEEEGTCIVQYLGYENEEEVSLNSIYPSEGETIRARQIEEAKQANEEQEQIHWEPGDLCLAMFSEDGLFYHAEIMQVYEEDGCCIVKFIGYENEEEVDMENIFPLSDDVGSLCGSSVVCASKSKTKSLSSLDESSSTLSSDQSSASGRRGSFHETSRSHSVPHGSRGRHHTFNNTPHVPDFLLPSSSVPVPVNVEMHDELGPMLMAWYMAGFHTGYYQGRSSRLSGKPTSNMCHQHER